MSTFVLCSFMFVYVYFLIKFALHIPLPYSTERVVVLGIGDKSMLFFLNYPFGLYSTVLSTCLNVMILMMMMMLWLWFLLLHMLHEVNARLSPKPKPTPSLIRSCPGKTTGDYRQIRSKAEVWIDWSLNVTLLVEQLVGIYLFMFSPLTWC